MNQYSVVTVDMTSGDFEELVAFLLSVGAGDDDSSIASGALYFAELLESNKR